jgi:hypothetical protein
MVGVVLATLVAALIATVVYVGRERLGVEGLGLAALRTVALGALFLVLFNPGSLRRMTGGAPTVLLDASLSMGAVGGPWQGALDSARALAGDGTILRFGAGLAPFDTMPPLDGSSRVRDALEASVGRTGPVFVVSDGEVQDGAVLPPGLMHAVTVVSLPRDTVPNAALLDVAVDRQVQEGDSIRIGLVVGTWGVLDTAGASIELLAGDRPLVRRRIALPRSPGTARRTVTIPPDLLGSGTHVVSARLITPGDAEARDDVRRRVVHVTSQPAIVVVVDPADVEGRFLMHEIREVASTTVRGFARIGADAWLDMTNLAPTDAAAVRRAARAARLVVLRGADRIGAGDGAAAVWQWPAASDGASEFFAGDWYVTREVPASPLAGRLAAATWDSVPPLTGIVPFVAGGTEWVAITGRRARRGVDRPILVGRDSSGTRRLTTAGLGLWRWVLRGGAARETYRAVVAAGTDWLLRTGTVQARAPLTAEAVAQRGEPVVFRWTGEDIPDSTVVSLAGADSTVSVTLRYDPRGTAMVLLEPGVYRWDAPGVQNASGIAVVEEYSDEYHPRGVTLGAGLGESRLHLMMRRAREAWWLFLIAMAAFITEWGWRQRRGLP